MRRYPALWSAALVLAGPLAVQSARSVGVDEREAPIWPQRGYDPTHHARSPYQGPSSQGYIRSMFPTKGNGISDYPVITTAGYIIVVDTAGEIYAVQPTAGGLQQVWEDDTGDSGRATGSPALLYGQVVVPLANGEIYITASETGQNGFIVDLHQWLPNIGNATVGDIVLPPLAAPDVELILTWASNVLIALEWKGSQQPSQPVWTWTATAQINGISIRPAASGYAPIVFVACGDGTLSAIEFDHATPMWSFNLNSPLLEEPAVSRDGAHVFINTARKGTFKIAALTGTIEVNAPSELDGGASINIGQTGTLFIGGADRVFYALNDRDLSVKWSAHVPHTIFTQALTDAAGYVYFVDSGGIVSCYDTVSGTQSWSIALNESVSGGMAISNDHCLYLPASSGNIYQICGARAGAIIPKTAVKSAAQWSQRGGNPQHTGQSQFNGPPGGSTIGQVWTFKFTSEFASGAVVGKDGTVVVPDVTGDLLALDGNSGRLKWRRPNPAAFINGEAAFSMDSSRVYFADTSGYVHALNAQTGQEIWTTSVGSAVLAPVTVSVSDNVVVMTEGALLYALRGTDGAVLFELSTGLTASDFSAAYEIDDRTIIIGSEDFFVYAYDSVTKQLRWRFQTHGPMSDIPCVHPGNGVIFVGSANEIVALDGSFGDQLWLQSSDVITGASPACGGPDGLLYVGSMDGSVHALDETTGDDRWVLTTGDRVYATPIISHDGHTVYVTSTDGNVYSIDAETGAVLFKFFVAPLLRGSPTLMSDGGIIVTSLSSNSIYKIGPPSLRPTPTPTPGPAPGGVSTGGAVAISLLVCAFVYVGAGYGWSFYKDRRFEHPHGQFWSRVGRRAADATSDTVGWIRGRVSGSSVPSGYSRSGLVTSSSSSSSSSSYGATPAVSSKVGSGYGAL